MSWKDASRKGAMCVCLLGAALGGAPISPEQIEQLMQTMNRTTIEYVLPEASGGGKGRGKKRAPRKE